MHFTRKIRICYNEVTDIDLRQCSFNREQFIFQLGRKLVYWARVSNGNLACGIV